MLHDSGLVRRKNPRTITRTQYEEMVKARSKKRPEVLNTREKLIKAGLLKEKK